MARNLICALVVALSVCGCGDKESFTQQATTQYFLQDFNPEYLDVLWVLDDRSPMTNARDNIVAEARKFFIRLDGLATADYQMGLVTADMQFAQGVLQPKSAPVLLKKSIGTVEQRANTIAALISQTINLHTGALDEGFRAAHTALKSSFVPRTNVPLVLVFISDSDDHSSSPSGDALSYYSQQFLSMKGGNANLLRVYSVNYTPTGGRCATKVPDAEIDRSDFQDRYFQLANLLGGSTANLCSTFADKIDLSGLKFKDLPRRFKLEQTPNPSSIQVSVFDKSQTFLNVKWNYDSSTNDIVFETAPPQGSTIQVTYNLK